MATSLLFCLYYYLAGSYVLVVVHVLDVGKSLVIDDLSLDISDSNRVQFVMLCSLKSCFPLTAAFSAQWCFRIIPILFIIGIQNE